MVELTIEKELQIISLDEVKKRVLDSFGKWHGWVTRDDYDELLVRITSADSIQKVIDLLGD